MPDPNELWLPLEDRVVLYDPLAAQVRVVGWRPGPAGVSALELVDGLHVVVDHASPTTLAELAVSVAGGAFDPRTLDLIATLVGDEATEVVATLPSRPTQVRSTRTRTRTRDADDDLRDPFAERRHRRFAQLVLGADLGEDALLSDTARGVALVEAALAAFDVFPPAARELARRGFALVSAPPRDAKRGARLESLFRSVAEPTGLWRDADAAIDRLRRSSQVGRVRRMGPAPAPAAAAAPQAMRFASESAAAGAAKASVTADSAAPVGRPIEVDGEQRGWAWLDDGNNVRVTGGPTAEGAWARVFRRDDRLLLGLAPMRADGALVVIPPVDRPDELVVDLVTDPGKPRRAAAHDQLRAAILTGRRAARLTRLGDPAQTPTWDECARRWDELGDPQRANLARRHGGRDDLRVRSPRRRGTTVDPLLADELD